MSPLSSGMVALMIGALLSGCLKEPASTVDPGSTSTPNFGRDDGATSAGTAESTQFQLDDASMTAQLSRVRRAFSGTYLQRITANSTDFVLGYHGETPYASEQEEALDMQFLEVFQSGKYEEITSLKSRFEALLPQNDQLSGSAKALARLGFLNIWEVGERFRGLKAGESVANPQAMMQNFNDCTKYFAAASARDPNNGLYVGFHGLCNLYLGFSGAPDMEDEVALGLKLAASSLRRNPDFNLFSLAYILTARPADTPEFAVGLDMLWRNFDVCFDDTIDRKTPDVTGYVATFVPYGNKRFCMNSQIAPHNTEGFSLVFGDILLKANQPEAAKVMYANAKILPSYQTWPQKYREILEYRIANAEALVESFRKPINPIEKPDFPTITFFTEDHCMVCHRN